MGFKDIVCYILVDFNDYNLSNLHFYKIGDFLLTLYMNAISAPI